MPADRRTLVIATVLTISAGLLYLLTGPSGPGGDEYIPLAGALLRGQLTVDAREWIELVPTRAGWVVPFPPVPVLFYLPIVAIMGVQPWWAEMSAGVMPALIGGLAVGLAYLLLRRLGVAEHSAVWICVGFATTTLWWAAGMGGTHLMAQVSAVLFLLAALYLAIGSERPGSAGLLFALAVGSRLPVGLALPLFLYLYRGRSVRFLVGAFPVAAAIGLYNLARFGAPLEFGYGLIPGVTTDPMYHHGIMSPLYIPRGVAAAFLSWPTVVDQAPYVRPSLYADSLLLTAPFMAATVLARGRLPAVAAMSAVLVLLVDLMHGAPGVAQIGYRFILDSMPLWLVVVGTAVRYRVPPWVRLTVVAGALVTGYAFWASATGFTSM